MDSFSQNVVMQGPPPYTAPHTPWPSASGSPHTGILAEDGPGLWQRLARLYGTTARAELAEVYRHAFESGACLEPHLKRTPGASFAPRPLRILSLLIEIGSLDGAPSVDLAREALEADVPHRSVAPLFNAIRLLDDLRHLHMLDLQKADPTERLAHYRSVYAAVKLEQKVPRRLTTLLESAFTRYEKHHASDSQSA